MKLVKDFSDTTLKALPIKEKIDILDFIKIKKTSVPQRTLPGAEKISYRLGRNTAYISERTYIKNT